jgi:integrase
MVRDPRHGAPVRQGGLRAKEIAMVTWSMVTDADGNVGDALHLLNGASKGKKGGRTVPLNATLRDALIALKARRNGVEPGDRIIHSERDIGGAVQQPVILDQHEGSSTIDGLRLKRGATFLRYSACAHSA